MDSSGGSCFSTSFISLSQRFSTLTPELLVEVAYVHPISPINIEAPHGNLWKPLSGEEKLSVQELLCDRKELSLSPFIKAGLSVSSIPLIKLITPNKTDALHYLDSSIDHKPARFKILTTKAIRRAVLFNSGYAVPHITELQVGPLIPVSSETKAVPFFYTYKNSIASGV